MPFFYNSYNSIVPALAEGPLAYAEQTPIAIDFTPILGDDRRLSDYYLVIEVSDIWKRGVTQFMPGKRTLRLPDNGVLRFKLPPSTVRLPYARYDVSYFTKGSKLPFQKQDWLVPPVSRLSTYSFTTSDSDSIQLPLHIWQVNALNPVQAFTSDFNTIYWLPDGIPPEGTTYEIEYEPAVTLDRILEYSNQNLK